MDIVMLLNSVIEAIKYYNRFDVMFYYYVKRERCK